ncbi:MAG: hydroxymyristoyl-ACP dehydratase [Geobacter sp.]|nr:hydroxymyristoyl-ACP dehydratase [Geobacter sp.]
MFSTDPAAYLPHRYPFLFLDRIVCREQGCKAEAVALVSAGVSFFPPMILLEAMAQLAGVAAAEREGEGGFLAAVEHAEITAPPQPGDRLQVSVSIIKSFGRLHLVEGVVRRGDTLLATAKLTLGVGEIAA